MSIIYVWLLVNHHRVVSVIVHITYLWTHTVRYISNISPLFTGTIEQVWLIKAFLRSQFRFINKTFKEALCACDKVNVFPICDRAVGWSVHIICKVTLKCLRGSSDIWRAAIFMPMQCFFLLYHTLHYSKLNDMNLPYEITTSWINAPLSHSQDRWIMCAIVIASVNKYLASVLPDLLQNCYCVDKVAELLSMLFRLYVTQIKVSLLKHC